VHAIACSCIRMHAKDTNACIRDSKAVKFYIQMVIMLVYKDTKECMYKSFGHIVVVVLLTNELIRAQNNCITHDSTTYDSSDYTVVHCR
jgi:hypothetical protein